MKKLTCFLLCLVLAVSSLILAHAEQNDCIIGDTNLDNNISIVDATYIQMYLVQKSDFDEQQLLCADVDLSSNISIIDATIIQFYVAKIIDTLPYNPFSDIVGTIKDDNSITLYNNLGLDTYTLRYEDNNGVLEDYADICTLEITQNEIGATYSTFISENKAPVSATKIGVYNSSGQRVGSIELTYSIKAQDSEKLYSFSALSDVHVGLNENNKEYYLTSTEDFKRALQYLNNEEKVDFNCICGDLTVYASENELAYYKSIVDEFSSDTPVYVAAGNHEEYKAYTSEFLESYTGNPLYYYFEKGNDVFIMLGIISSFEDRTFLDGELQWLYEVLEQNRNKRCFIFEHVLTEDGSGDALKLHTGSTLDKEPTSLAFKNLLQHYTNTVYFHGHSHMQFALQQYSDTANYDKILGSHSVHIPSLSVPRGVSDDGKRVSLFEDSEGYVVDVYENGVFLKGRDFVNGKFLPVAQYYLDTTLKPIDENTFVDTTGVIDTSVTTK